MVISKWLQLGVRAGERGEPAAPGVWANIFCAEAKNWAEPYLREKIF